ncbi:unnamed protein product [Bursaphelenchus xylophilus]|uniref:(pine wood nematode) hypothetical protein n=1 Tax=Bursaphelenchus xylophilus TaxID=6326 RepID=A0A1I7SSC6_BURXY|nr:unnamed protein product [Bursaphelenchus xylophilus]CAG9097728.1 unnamed protein product [Bursaphelenchus xylophilus]
MFRLTCYIITLFSPVVLLICVFLQDVHATDKPVSCQDLFQKHGSLSGIFEIRTKCGEKWAFCDQQSRGGGWTVIQQRNGLTGETFWNRSWEDYKIGFGTPHSESEFWLGNDVIHDLSNRGKRPALLRVELFGDRTPRSKWENSYFVSEYDFRIGNETANYELEISAHRPLKKLSNGSLPRADPEYFVGNASFGWYDITTDNKAPFSTVDKINDPLPDCVIKFHLGGWWTKWCGTVSLNGEYTPEKMGGGYGLNWLFNGSYFIHPRRTRMMIRQRWDDL